MRNQKEIYRKLFCSTFQLSACTFGGGFVIIPLMRRKFVEEFHWIEEEEMMDLTAIAQSAPGAIAVNASILIGYRVAGFKGALLTVLGTILPPLLIISVIAYCYQTVRDNPVVQMALAGMTAGVAAVVCDVVICMIQGIIKQKKGLYLLILAGAFLAVAIWKVNIIFIILVCALLGAADTLISQKRGVKHDLS